MSVSSSSFSSSEMSASCAAAAALEVSIRRAADAIRNCNALLITAGAGMGVDSGLPDFRGKEGFWRAYPAISKLGLRFEEMSNPTWFKQDPLLAWAFFGHRWNLYSSTTPHDGFRILKDVICSRPNITAKNGHFVFTSNVDGSFQKAGFSEEKLVECHGSIHHLQCTKPCSDKIWTHVVDRPRFEIVEDTFKLKSAEEIPKCIHCQGAIARPNILMFGDGNWVSYRTDEQEQRFDTWMKSILHHQDEKPTLVILEFGAGLAVPTIRLTGENMARMCQKAGGTASLIRVNPTDTEVPSGHISLPMGSLAALQRIEDELRREF